MYLKIIMLSEEFKYEEYIMYDALNGTLTRAEKRNGGGLLVQRIVLEEI